MTLSHTDMYTQTHNTNKSHSNLKKRARSRDFSGGPVGKTQCFHWTTVGAQVRSLVGELRSCTLSDMAKKRQEHGLNQGSNHFIPLWF